VRFVSGSYRKQDVSGMTFQLVEGFKTTAKGGHVTVKNGNVFPGFPDEVRIKCDGIKDYAFTAEGDITGVASLAIANGVDTAALPHVGETDDEVIARIRERFGMLDEMAQAVVEGQIRAMIVSGPPGVGKSYGVEQIIEKACLFDHLAGRKLRAEVVKGAVTAASLYMLLYKYSDPDSVLVFDDCDSVLLDDVALNLLKGALDSGKKRKISWLADSNALRKEGIPDSFDFKGSIIFISNLKFDKFKGKLAEHLAALQSRCHYLDLTMDTMRDKVMRVKQIHEDGHLFDDLQLDDTQADEVIEFMNMNQNKLREVSLRMAIKIGQLRKSFDAKWKQMAMATCTKA
jgi:hypothetical protein